MEICRRVFSEFNEELIIRYHLNILYGFVIIKCQVKVFVKLFIIKLFI